MDKQPVGQLPDLTQSNNDDEIMVITNSEYNQLKKEKISDLITDFTSTNENNALTKGTDGKMFVTDFGNASNITEGTLPVSVLPDIPKDKLPEIETDDLPDSGITAGTYTYPTDIVINSKGQVTSITEGQAGANNANQDLSNLGPLGLDKINQSKALETGNVSSDADVYADVQKYAHSTFDLSKFEVVGSPTISDDGILTNTSNLNYVLVNNIDLRTANIWEIDLLINIQDTDLSNNICLVFNTDNRLVFQISTDLKISLFINLGIKNINFSSNTNIIQQGSNKVKLKYDSSSGYNIFVNDIKVASDTTTSKTIANGSFYIGGGYNTLFMNEPNSIDLKSIAIWADGIPVFNGNKTGTDTFGEIEIPYTLSKTGSKIVDVAYHDRVQDLYEQTGEALFYTIDEQNQNFTLPMGDIYGMIERKNDELNNPFSLFDFKYADAPIYNMSWLQANGSWYAKSVYISAYEALVVENNSEIEAGTSVTLPSGGNYVKRGLSVKLSTAEDITDFDFVINTTDETFKLPLLNGSEINIDYSQGVPITSGYIAPCNGVVSGGNNSLRNTSAVLRINDEIVAYAWGGDMTQDGTNIYVKVSKGDEITFTNLNTVETSTRNPVTFFPAAGNGLLYFYVGETTQSSYIINASQKLNYDASNLTEPGKTNIKNLVYPDFNNTVSLPITLNLVQQADKDCYLHVNARSGSDLAVDICDADGVTKLTLISSDTAANIATIITSPLIPAGTYFKVSRNVGTENVFIKIYTTGESNV